MSKDKKEYGYEGEMVMSQLKAIIQHAEQLHDLLEPDTDLPEWVQSKITLAYDYVQTAADYMATELDEEANLQELSKGLLNRYQDKNYQDRKRLASGLWYPKGEAGATEKQKKDSAKLGKRVASDYLAYKKANPKTWAKDNPPHLRAGDKPARVHATEEAPINSAGGGNLDESIYDYDKNKTKVRIKGKPSGNRWTMHTRLVGQPGEYSTIIQTHRNGTELKNEYGGYNSYKVGKTAYVKKHWDKLSEEAPTNSAGGGAIDGIGVGPKGEPGVKPKAMKRYKDKNAEEAPKAGRKTLSLFMKGE